MNNLVVDAVASLTAGLATVIGALPILLPIKITKRVQGIMLGFGGGVMLAATSFSLIGNDVFRYRIKLIGNWALGIGHGKMGREGEEKEKTIYY